MLVVWGKYDPSFALPEAEAYKREIPGAEVHVLEAGHFALDEAVDQVAAFMRIFLVKTLHRQPQHPLNAQPVGKHPVDKQPG